MKVKPFIYSYLADLVFKRTGIHYPEKDFYRLDGRITSLMTKYDCSDPDELYSLFSGAGTIDMENSLIDICTNNETYFFRDEKPFDAISKSIIPKMAESGQKKFDIWCCASSTGQEPTSILMSLAENYPQLNFEDVTLRATDICNKALAKAKSGIYSNLDVQRGLPIQLLIKYFDSIENDSWKIKDVIKSQIIYDKFNLFSSQYPVRKYDIIFCRNVLIYQNKENKTAILHNIAKALKPGGHLIMGAGESLIGTGVTLKNHKIDGALVFIASKEDIKAAKAG